MIHLHEAIADVVVQGHLAIAGIHDLCCCGVACYRNCVGKTSSGTGPEQLPSPSARHVCHFAQPGNGRDRVLRATWAPIPKRNKRLRRSIHFVVVPVHAQVALVDIVPGASGPAGMAPGMLDVTSQMLGLIRAPMLGELPQRHGGAGPQQRLSWS